MLNPIEYGQIVYPVITLGAIMYQIFSQIFWQLE